VHTLHANNAAAATCEPGLFLSSTITDAPFLSDGRAR